MNILFLSKLTGNLFAGPNHSVPMQVKSQSKVDHVMWYNLNYVKRPEWEQNGLKCKNFSDYPTGRLDDLPAPFCHPDLVIVEEFYCYPFSKIISDIQIKKIPYIIVPRSELTEQAQEKKKWKKRIGNLLYFNNMAHKASAIQYLSQQEYIESGNKWNPNSFIVPNGTYFKDNYKSSFSNDVIKAVYVGRFEQYQKGLDILLEAVVAIKDELKKAGFQLNLYGVDQEGTVEWLNQQIDIFGISDLIKINEAIYGEEKERILIQSDVFIMTSRFEGMPMGLIEALSYGLPCIATVGTNLVEEINEYDAGWTAQNTSDSVQKALLAMIHEYDNIAVKSHNARNLSKIYSWDTIAEKSHDIYTKLLNCKK